MSRIEDSRRVARVLLPLQPRPSADDRDRVRPVFEACASQLRTATREAGIRRVPRDRLRALRTHLAAALAEVDRLLGAEE